MQSVSLQGVPPIKMDIESSNYTNGHCTQEVDVDVCAKATSTARVAKIKEQVMCFLAEMEEVRYNTLYSTFDGNLFLKENIERIQICESALDGDLYILSKAHCKFLVHVYQCHHDGPASEEIDGQEDVSAANHWILPAVEFEGLWENLVFDSDIKSNLLQYARTTMLFSAAKVDCNIISWNRVVLLHGPPGTGKTSLCKALAQKLCIRMSDKFRYGQLVEINSHGLFSKWFSESGKLVVKMFQKIQELIDDPEALVCILMDEVESLTAVRKASSNEPSDAIRVVNALLTQIDQIKRFPNVLILTTSNVTGAIDLAFVDRADIKQYIGLPSAAAIYKIFTSCLLELMRAGIISPALPIYDWTAVKRADIVAPSVVQNSQKLSEICYLCMGLSGRTIRKLPFLAHALFVQASVTTLGHFLSCLESAARVQIREREDLGHITEGGIST